MNVRVVMYMQDWENTLTTHMGEDREGFIRYMP